MKSKDLLSISDLSAEGIRMLISKALVMKTEGWTNRLSNKILILMFEKPSTRTRVSFEMAMRQMGGQCLYLSPDEVGLGKREPVPDAEAIEAGCGQTLNRACKQRCGQAVRSYGAACKSKL